MTQAQALGERIRRRRKALGISQHELAAKCGTHQTTISRREHGTEPTYAELRAIARALGLSVRALVK
jgi:transcriptional regulator with XRE-family HTH domain